MPLKGILAAELRQFVSDNPSLEGQGEPEQFQMYSLFHRLKEYSVELEDITGGIVDDADDFGVDAIYAFVDGKIMNSVDDVEEFFSNKSRVTIRVIQTKNGSGFKEGVLAKLKEGVEEIFDPNESELRGNAKFKNRAEIVRKLWGKFYTGGNEDVKIFIDYICSGDKKNANDKVQRKKLEIERSLKSKGLRSVEVNITGSGELIALSDLQGTYNKVLIAENSIVHNVGNSTEDDFADSMSNGEYILIVDGNKFFDFITDAQGAIEERIFERNVRDYQGPKKEVIKNIQSTLKSEKRSNFWRMNNGVTILASRISNKGDTAFRLENYQIINGCQTAFSIYEVLSNGAVGKFELVVKLVTTNETEIALEIIQATNSQISVEATAFNAQSKIHKLIEADLKDGDDKIYYERRSNFYRRRGVSTNKIVGPKKLFQIIRSIYFQKPCSSRRNPTEFFKKENDSIFNPDYEFLYYKIACILFLKTVVLSNKYKKKYDLDDYEIAIISNGIMPIARILFSLLVNSEDKVDMLDRNSELINNSECYMDRIKDLGIEKDGLFDKAFRVLVSSVGNCMGQDGEGKTVANVLKSNELEETYIPRAVKAAL